MEKIYNFLGISIAKKKKILSLDKYHKLEIPTYSFRETLKKYTTGR